jgi:hypothetical protein
MGKIRPSETQLTAQNTIQRRTHTTTSVPHFQFLTWMGTILTHVEGIEMKQRPMLEIIKLSHKLNLIFNNEGPNSITSRPKL